MSSNSFPHHDNYSTGTNVVPFALKVLSLCISGMQQLTRVPVDKVSNNSSRSR